MIPKSFAVREMKWNDQILAQRRQGAKKTFASLRLGARLFFLIDDLEALALVPARDLNPRAAIFGCG